MRGAVAFDGAAPLTHLLTEEGGEVGKQHVAIVFSLLALYGCSSGFKEVSFKDESGMYIVSRSLVNDRVTANQPHPSALLACSTKYTSEQMVELRKDGEEHSWYTQCQHIEHYRPGWYAVTSDQPIGTLYQGPISAAMIGAGVGAGLAMSGDSVTQSNRSSVSASSSATGGKVINKARRH